MRNSRKLRLFPINYQNDPEEGKVFYMRLAQYLKEKQKPTDIIDSITEHFTDKVAFIRSLTTHGNSLLIWNSSYAVGAGVSVGVSAKRINKGQGIVRELLLDEETGMGGTQKTTAVAAPKKSWTLPAYPWAGWVCIKSSIAKKALTLTKTNPCRK
jgi:hypothetical protein